MANPATFADFPEANINLVAPQDAKPGAVTDLPAYRSPDGSPRIWCTKWQLTPEDLAELQANGGFVYLRILGATHPVVGLSAATPFTAPGALEASAAAIIDPNAEQLSAETLRNCLKQARELPDSVFDSPGSISREALLAALEERITKAEQMEAAAREPSELPAD